MKLVIQKDNDGVIHAMFETEKRHKHIGRSDYYRVDACRLDEECDLSQVLGHNEYIAIDVVKPRKKK